MEERKIQMERTQRNSKEKEMQYKHLVSILKRNGAEKIELPMSDMIPFSKYLDKCKYKEKLYYAILKGKFIVSTKPLIQKQNEQKLLRSN